jgi:hypothetical protein
MEEPMRSLIAVAFAGALLAPIGSAAAGESAPRERIQLALNPQPEPPGRAKIKRIYTKEDDSRRPVKTKTPKTAPVLPATKY